MTLVGSYVGLSQWLLSALPVFVLAGLRFAIAAVCMIPWLRRRADDASLRPQDHGRLCGAAFIGTFLFSVCMLEGIARSGAVVAGIVMAALPGMVALWARVWLGERLNGRTLIGIACTVVGVALAQADSRLSGPGDGPAAAWGVLLLIAAVACEATYVVLGRQLAQTVSPRRISAWVNLWGLAFTTPLALWQWPSLSMTAVTPLHGVVLLYYALAASVFSVWLWMRGIRHVGAARAGVFTAFLPVTATLVGIALGEPMGPMRALALALALSGVVLATNEPVPRTSTD